jgi:hypothetical protein
MRMIALLLTCLGSLKVAITGLVVNGLDEQEILELAEGMMQHKLSPPIVLDFISRILRKVVEDAVETTGTKVVRSAMTIRSQELVVTDIFNVDWTLHVML